jgi:hypothetical protein
MNIYTKTDEYLPNKYSYSYLFLFLGLKFYFKASCFIS